MVVAALAGSTPVTAQRAMASPGLDRATPSADSLWATERVGKIRIDGQLEETAWTRAEAITDFVQGTPVEGAPPEQRTVVRVVYDTEAIYVGARLFEEDGNRVARQLVRRDETGQADYFEVSFDPNRDRRTGYQFRVTAAGVQRDAYLHDDSQVDGSWDAVWDSDVRVSRRRAPRRGA